MTAIAIQRGIHLLTSYMHCLRADIACLLTPLSVRLEGRLKQFIHTPGWGVLGIRDCGVNRNKTE